MEIFCKKKIQKKYNLFFKQFNIFFLIFQTFILFSFIKYTNNLNKLPFSISKAIKLLNDNILLVYGSGINIYDSFLNNSISELVKFNNIDSNVLTKFNLARFNENNDNDLIFIIKSQNIYILNNVNGSLIYEEKNSSITTKLQDNYQCLTPINKKGNIYFYMIGFQIISKTISLLFFKYDKDENKNIFLDSNEYKLDEEISPNIISCQIMLNQNENEVIICFYACQNNAQLGTIYINPNDYTKIEKDKKIQVFTSGIKGLKSITSSDKKNV